LPIAADTVPGLNGHEPSVEEFLRLPPLHGARILAGGDGLARRAAPWIAVIEWPVEDFVGSGEIVLTTGIGCDADMFTQLATEVVGADAAALCVSLNPSGGGLREVPSGVGAVCDERGCPLIEIPWEVRFADVTKAMIDRTVSARTPGEGHPLLDPGFTTAVLEGRGLDAVAAALEQMIDRPVVILDAHLQPAGRGPLVAGRLGEGALEACWRAVESMPAAELGALRRAAVAYRPRHTDRLGVLGLEEGSIVCAAAKQEILGYVYALSDAELDPVASAALQLAAAAVAMDLLRRRAVADTEERLRGEFFWGLADAPPTAPEEAATKAVLLGLDPRGLYEVAAGGADDAAATARRLRGESPDAIVAVRGRELLVLGHESARPLATLLEAAGGGASGAAASWGIAEGEFKLLALHEAYAAARRALRVGVGMRGPGAVADGASLAPFLMLSALARDEHAVGQARALLAPLAAYDEQTSRGLVDTLEAFLDEHGNTSAAARRLHFNRHALIYRLRKIEEMTGRSLGSQDDRFLFELSLKLIRMVDAVV
jgi:purine catabolism regulator